MSKQSEAQGVKEQVKQKRGCMGNSAAKSCEMCKVCSRNRAKYTNVKIENK